MAGELWRQVWACGLESVAGTSVAATRALFLEPESRLTRERESRPHRFATGTRDNVRAHTLGPQIAGGTISMPLSASEIIELLLIGIKGGVTPTTPAAGVYLWTFVPGSTALDPATIEWHDGARGLQLAGAYANTLRFAGNVRERNIVTAELFGHDLSIEAVTNVDRSRVPDIIEGWESKVYIDSHEGTPGGTNKANLLINWDVLINNQLGRKYWADNTNAMGAVVTGEIAVEATLLIEAANAQAATEFANWDADTPRLVRLEFGNNEVISGDYKKFVTIDLPGAWISFDLGQTDEGTRAYELRFQYVYDPTNQFGVQVRCQNSRATAWDNGS